MNEIKIQLTKNPEDVQDNTSLAELLKKVMAFNEQVIQLIKEKSVPGPKGVKGDKGEKGEQGEQGQSIVGQQGVKGDKGEQGEKGEQGLQGKDGKDGLNGKDGRDGSPDTAEQIADKLNTLEEKIDVKVIKGLQKMFRSLELSIQETKGKFGGGMGTPMHETFSCNGVLTSFTLSNRVAANGNAAWIYYQGQFLVKTTHWSILGKTLSLTFTPDNGTNVDVTYIRS